MADTTDINIRLGQGNAIKQITRANQQPLQKRRLAAAKKRKDKGKKKSASHDKSASTKGSKDQRGDSGHPNKKGKGTRLDVII